MRRSKLSKLVLATAVATAVATAGTAATAGQITLFESPNFQGRYIAAGDALPTVELTALNRTATSLVVGDGVWEACSEPYFHGRCAQFTPGSYSALGGEFYGPIASVRQVAYGSNPSRVTLQTEPSAVTTANGSVVINPGPAPVVINPGNNAVVLNSDTAARPAVVAPMAPAAIAPTPPVAVQPDTRMVLYQYDARGARAVELTGDIGNLDERRFDNRANAAFVLGGVWRLCDDTRGRGHCADFSPGRYATLGNLDGSVRSAYVIVPAREGVASTTPLPLGRLIMYQYSNFGGPSAVVEHGRTPDLDWANFKDRAESMRIDSGTWLVCSNTGYQGDCRVFGPGSYPELNALVRDGAFSARQVWRPEYGAADVYYPRR